MELNHKDIVRFNQVRVNNLLGHVPFGVHESDGGQSRKTVSNKVRSIVTMTNIGFELAEVLQYLNQALVELRYLWRTILNAYDSQCPSLIHDLCRRTWFSALSIKCTKGIEECVGPILVYIA